MTSFYGYNVIGNGAALRPHLLRLQPTTVFYMDAWGEASWATQNLPNTVVIHRVFKPEEDTMHRTPGRVRAHLQERASEGGDSRVFRNLGTEPHIADDNDLKRLIDEYLLALQWAKSAGLRVAAPHFAHYGLSERHWPIVEPLTTFIAGNPDITLFTCDEYGAGHSFSGVLHPGLPGGNEAGHIQPETWHASPVPYYYHVGRITNLFRWLQANGKPLPRTVITEAGMDALGDVTNWRNSLIKAPGYSDVRGWKSLTSQWQAWYGNRGWTPERAYVEMLTAVWREIYKPWTNIMGACLYCWGTNNDRQWDQFRLDGATEFQTRLEATVFESGGPPVTTPATIPIPADKGAGIRATLKEDYNLRAGSGVAFAPIATLRAGTEVTYYPDTVRADLDTTKTRQWVVVESAGVTPGWMAYQTQFAPLTPALPDWWPIDERALGVPFQTQRGTGTNNCGPASLTMVLRYWMARRGLPGDVDVQDVIAAVNNNGGYASFADLIRAANGLGLTLHQSVSMTGAALVNEIKAGRPVIALVERGKLPGTQAYYAFTGSHFVVVHAYDATGFIVHDPLSYADGAGDGLHVNAADFMAAWESTTGNAGRYQALTLDESAFEPTPEPEEPPVVVPPLPTLPERIDAAYQAWMETGHELFEAKAAVDAVHARKDRAQADYDHATQALMAAFAEYNALKQETVVNLTLVTKDSQENIA